MYIDPNGEFFWFIIGGAILGSYIGKSVQSKNWKPFGGWKEGWQGAIAGAFIGAAAGGMLASAVGASGMLTAAGEATKVWGITSSMLNSASVNIGINAISGGGWDGAWKAGLVGAATGGWSVTGGFGMVKGFGATSDIGKLAGKLGYQMIGTAGSSIGNNWAQGKDPFSKVSVGVGPVNLTLGKGQKLLQWQNNLGNIITNSLGLANLAFKVDGVRGRADFDWKNLAPVYSGGLMEHMKGAWGPYSVMSPSGILEDVKSHEMHHIWQSRSFNVNSFKDNFGFLLNYSFQGVNALLMRQSPIFDANYFERQAYGEFWW